jgi:hypothetical protein
VSRGRVSDAVCCDQRPAILRGDNLSQIVETSPRRIALVSIEIYAKLLMASLASAAISDILLVEVAFLECSFL